MRKIFCILLLVSMFVASSFAQVEPHRTIRRIKIYHADPQLIYMLLRGTANFGTGPEMSTFDFSSLPSGGFNSGGSGNGFGNGGFGNNGFGGSSGRWGSNPGSGQRRGG